MIKVSLLNEGKARPALLMSHAAKMCYEAETPRMGQTIDLESRIFLTGHHTILQHVYFTFLIEDISVGDLIFGLHLASPFYNSSERSGRFCVKMFANSDPANITAYIKNYWPGMDAELLRKIVDYVKHGLDIFKANIQPATEKAKEFIKEERPFADEKYIEQNAPKIAQEQLRAFIPTVVPTALDFTINLCSLVALCKVAWSPVMRDVTRKMATLVLKDYPEFSYMFNGFKTIGVDSTSATLPTDFSKILKKPRLDLISLGDTTCFFIPLPEELQPVDLLHYSPDLMENNIEEIKTDVEISVGAMHQDQRHRAVKRGKPYFTGGFYLPPIADALNLEEEGLNLLEQWMDICEESKMPVSLACTIAPYGVMVSYRKLASYNAAVHELHKRLCWCSQEEIYHLARALLKNINDNEDAAQLKRMMAPTCALTNKCGEGSRYCGRDFKKISTDPFPKRKI